MSGWTRCIGDCVCSGEAGCLCAIVGRFAGAFGVGVQVGDDGGVEMVHASEDFGEYVH